jgi:hypothetical protein
MGPVNSRIESDRDLIEAIKDEDYQLLILKLNAGEISINSVYVS